MKPFEEMAYHSDAEKLVSILCDKTQNSNPLFFRVLVAYTFSVAASMMRCTVVTHDRGEIPVNMFAMNLSSSGSGKGHSTNIIETSVMNQFRQRFLEETFPELAEINLPKLAHKRAVRKGVDPEDELKRVKKEFEGLGSLFFSFDSGTTAAVKQMRHKLLMADAGALNLQIDEIGSNLLGNVEVLTAFLELYDVGLIKQKLVKNTADNIRNEEIVGRTPTNLMMFGTPAKLLNGGKSEEELYSMLETGYARRCFFGFSSAGNKAKGRTAQEVYDMLTSNSNDVWLEDFSDRLEKLADIVNANKRLIVSKDTSLLLIEYKILCDEKADELEEYEETKRAELQHRYMKALKLAGAYAFIDNSPSLTDEHVYSAIKLVEESGAAFAAMLGRDRPWVKLAKYLVSVKREVTQPEMVEDLPFYNVPQTKRNELMGHAIAHGYRHNIIIKRTFVDGIEFFNGEALKETDLSKCIVAYGAEMAHNYRNDTCAFTDLHKMTQAPDIHWISHHLTNGDKGLGHRTEDHCIPGFNLVVVDVDTGISMLQAENLLKGYSYLMYSTKRSTDDENRFRIILPTNFELKLDAKDFKEFMTNIYDWLPFDVDRSTNQRARKWLSNSAGIYVYNEGETLDVLPFIPKTSKNEKRKELLNNQQSLDNLERWVLNNSGDGNRNNMLLRYGMILIEAGMSLNETRSKILDLNNKMPDKLDEMEILSTIMVSVTKAHLKQP